MGTALEAQEGTVDTSLQSLREQAWKTAASGRTLLHQLPVLFPMIGGDMRGVGLEFRGQRWKGFLGNAWVAPPSLGSAPSHKGLRFYRVSP